MSQFNVEYGDVNEPELEELTTLVGRSTVSREIQGTTVMLNRYLKDVSYDIVNGLFTTTNDQNKT